MALRIGIPKELKIGERRVSLTPKGVALLVKKGLEVYVEREAGTLSGFSNEEYEKVGARLVGDREELWKKADLIKKVKEPVPEEFQFFESRHIIFTYLHLASPSAAPLIKALLRSKATAVAYETIEVNGSQPLLKPMSEIAGVLSAYAAAVFKSHVSVQNLKIEGLEVAKPMLEQLASKYPEVPKGLKLGRVVILGGGHVGGEAAKMAARMGGEVFLSELSEKRRRELKQEFKSLGLKIEWINPADQKTYEMVLASSDVIIACVHASGKRAPVIIDSMLLGKITATKKKTILDIAIDQGGNVAESRPVDYENPLYLDSFGNLRFAVANIPSLCGRGASVVLEEVSLDYTLALGESVDEAIKRYPELESGINIFKGEIAHPAVREAHLLNP